MSKIIITVSGLDPEKSESLVKNIVEIIAHKTMIAHNVSETVKLNFGSESVEIPDFIEKMNLNKIKFKSKINT